MNRVSAPIVTLAALLTLTVSGCSTSSRHHPTALPDPVAFNAHFGDMDADGNEQVTREEFAAFFPQAGPDVFEALDLNRDAIVDHDEWHAFKEAHGLKHAQ